MAGGSRRDNRTPKQRADNAVRERQCFELARRGLTVEEIRAEMGYAGRQSVHDVLRRAIRAHVGPAAKNHLRRELRRIDLKILQLDAIFAGLTKALEVTVTEDAVELRGGAFAGNVEAAEAAMKCIAEQRKWAEHRCRLLNLIKPGDVNVAAGAMILHLGPMAAQALEAPDDVMPDDERAPTDGSTH